MVATFLTLYMCTHYVLLVVRVILSFYILSYCLLLARLLRGFDLLEFYRMLIASTYTSLHWVGFAHAFRIDFR